MAWTNEAKILAPEGVTRRQLYVLAHECGHIVLHSSREGQAKPGHVKEHEAETYAHRAFARYGIEVPAKSAQWARAYVGQWIMKDKAAGLDICPQAALFALGQRSPHDPLPSIEGQPPNDFSKSLEKFVAKGERTIAKQELIEPRKVTVLTPVPKDEHSVPVGCGTCAYFDATAAHLYKAGYKHHNSCKVHMIPHETSWHDLGRCNAGQNWRPVPAPVRQFPTAAPAAPTPKRASFLSRLSDAIIERVAGRNRRD